MAYASVTYTSASGTTFALTNSSGNPIQYLRQADISVTVNGVLKTLTTDYTFNSAGTAIVLNSAVSGATVVLSRTTSITDATVSFTAGSTLTAQDLNNSDKQNRFALQEFSDTYGALTTGTGDLSALGGFIGSAEVWVADNAHAATTGAIDARIDSKNATKLTDDVVAGNAITVTDNSPSSGKITIAVTDGAIETAELADNAVTAAKLASNAVTATKIQDGAVTNAKLADAELQTLAGIGSAEASSLVALTNAEIQTLDGITVSTAELNQLDGISVSTSFTNSATQIATSSAINSFVTNLLDSLGGFVAIPDDQSFPTTNPDPSDNAGTVVSIADAGGLVIDASGTTTTGRTTAGSVVTITGFPAVYRSSTLLAGLGIQVQTTTTLNTYTYHKSLPTDADIAQLNDDVNDFFARYRISATDPTTNLDTGDLVFNTTANELRVYNGSAWQGGVTATGNLVSKSGDTMTGALGITSGSAGSPSLFISGDTNTGIYSPGADQVAISTGGTQRLLLDSSGNVNIDSNTLYVDATNNRVGLGTSSPSRLFHVSGTTDTPAQFQTSQSNLYIQLANSSASNGYIGFEGTNLSLWNNGANRLNIDSSGRVGIGTTSITGFSDYTTVQLGSSSSGAAMRLVANGDTPGTDDFVIYKNTSGSYLRSYGDPLIFYGNSSEYGRWDTSGRLLVGTSTASGTAPLQVNGAISTVERTITTSAFDMGTGNYWTCGAIAIPNPTNAVAGMSGLIRVSAAPTSFGSNFDFPGGAYTAPATFPAVVPYYVVSSSQILLGSFTEGIA